MNLLALNAAYFVAVIFLNLLGLIKSCVAKNVNGFQDPICSSRCRDNGDNGDW